jgi:hypothetical protein
MGDMAVGSYELQEHSDTKITGYDLTRHKKLMKNLSYEDRNG